MTPVVVTPSHVIPEDLAPVSTGPPVHLTYEREEIRSFRVDLPAPAPPELRVNAHFGIEETGAWASVPELDISAEGEDLGDALRNLISTTRDWLSYLREEQPELSEALRAQERYVPLHDAPEFSWFKSIKLD